MSRINDLIQKYCPNGCEYKTIGKLCNIVAGGDMPKTHMSDIRTDDYPYPIYSNGIGENALCGFTDVVKVDRRSVTVSARGTIGYAALRTEPFFPIVRLLCLVPKEDMELNPDFLRYIMEIQHYDLPMSGIPQLTKPDVENREIPVPPLPVQEEIVRILDSYTEIESELEVKLADELEMRKKQYEYYRDKMLSLSDYDGEVKTYRLSELVTRKITDGMHNLPKNIVSSGYAPILSAVNIYDGELHVDTEKYVDEETYLQENKRTDVSVDDVLLTIVATLGRVAVVKNPMKVLLQRSVAVIRPNQKMIISDYLRFYLETYDIQYFIQKHAHGAAQKGFYVNQINDLKITIPTDITEQKRIVDVLDKFSTLTSDISEGLPAEIKMRHQQYEYYRDKLLSFKRLDGDAV